MITILITLIMQLSSPGRHELKLKQQDSQIISPLPKISMQQQSVNKLLIPTKKKSYHIFSSWSQSASYVFFSLSGSLARVGPFHCRYDFCRNSDHQESQSCEKVLGEALINAWEAIWSYILSTYANNFRRCCSCRFYCFYDYYCLIFRKGLAQVEGMCSLTGSCTLSKDGGLGTAYTIAHETGHKWVQSWGLGSRPSRVVVLSSSARHLV